MASRPTPFGLFAGCGVGQIGERTSVFLAERARWRRFTRPDADYLDALIRERVVALREQLRFRPNGSLNRMAGRWRYVQSRLDGTDRSHHLVEVADSGLLRRALEAASEGATPAHLVATLAGDGTVEPEVARAYVIHLIEAQVLTPELDVFITGRLPLNGLIDDLTALGDEATAAVLRSVREDLASIDSEGIGAPAERHERIAIALGALGAPVERSRLLQVDVTIPHEEASLARSTAEDILRGLELLRRLSPPRRRTELDLLRDAFRDRYEGREVPLLEALDEELGIGLGVAGDHGDPAPLLAGIPWQPRGDPEAPFGRREQRLQELLGAAVAEGATEIVLDHDDIAALEHPAPQPLPAAGAVLAVLARTGQGQRVVISGARGPSGARLLGRFCHADPELCSWVADHLRAEEQLDPDALYAEIVHLPSGRMANLLARPVLRGHEIEWLGRSGAAPEARIPASDLLVSLRQGRFVLRSATLGRRVVARLSSARNYSRRSPGVYRFLASLQAEGVSEEVGWSWAPFEAAPFRPRVRFGRLILARASWRLTEAELGELAAGDTKARWLAMQSLRERRRMPRWICLVDYDNSLPIDLDNAISVEMLVRTVRARDEAFIEELVPGPDELVADAPDGRRALEVVVPYISPAAAGAPAVDDGDIVAPLSGGAVGDERRRTFPPGSEWAYLKLYTGTATADRLLSERVAPLARELVGSGGAERWFFLRYGDPRHHLRLRFRGEPAVVREAVERLATEALDAGLADDALIGTYRRELERYGGIEGTRAAERFFCADSDAVVELLGMFAPGARGLDERWRIGFLGAELLMTDLGLDVAVRAAQSRRMLTAFEREFRAGHELRRAVSAKARAELGALEQLLGADAEGDHPLAPGIRVLAERSRRMAPVTAELLELHATGRLSLPLEELAVSYVHMWLNRLCRSQNRAQEFLTYALLTRVHEARERRGRG